MTPPEAFAFLDLAPGASPDDVERAFRLKAKSLHPDLGGDPAAFMGLRCARGEALRYARTELCVSCRGAKRVTMTSHATWATHSMLCEVCSGTGLRHV